MYTSTDVDMALLERGLAVAKSLAAQAGECQLRAARSRSTIHHKGIVDLVTETDIESERIITEGLRRAFPDHRLTAEEGTTGADESPYRWLVDPLDGTTNFAHRQPHWAVSICLEHLGNPVMGVVFDPPKSEMFTAVIGQGAYLNGEPIHVSDISALRQAIGATGFSYDISGRADTYRLWQAFNDNAQAMRRNGAAALDMVWIACGRLDFYFEHPINNWDVSAGAIIAQEAGARVSRLNGENYEIDDREIATSNGMLHDQMLSLIRETIHE